MVEGVVEPQKEEGPSGLLAIQVLGRSEVLQVLVVRSNFDWVSGPFEEVLPLLKASYYRQELLIMHLVVPLHTGQAFGEEGNWVPLLVLFRELE